MAVEEDPERKYHPWLQLQRQWRKQYSVSKESELAIESALSPEVMFRAGSEMSTFVFYIGINPVDNFYYILVPDDFLPAIRHCMHMLLVSRTNTLSSSPPLAPRGIGKTYRSVRQVIFKSRSAYFGTISALRKINSKVRWLMYQIGSCFKLRKMLKARQIVIFSISINMCESKSIKEIAWTMFDTKSQRVLDQHYVTSNAQCVSIETDSKEAVGQKTPVIVSTKQALKILEKDITWAANRDKSVAVLAHDLPRCLLALKHHGWSRLWTKADGSIETDMFCLREMYEVMSRKLGHRASLAEIFNYLELPIHALSDTGIDAKFMLQAAIEMSKRRIPEFEDFGDISQFVSESLQESFSPIQSLGPTIERRAQ